MQKARPVDSDDWVEEVYRRRAQVREWVRDLGCLEAWKKVADRSVHMIFCSLPIFGPAMSDELKKNAVDAIYRLTWWQVCEGMTQEERIKARRANRKAMDEYSAEIAEKAVAERWKRARANSR